MKKKFVGLTVFGMKRLFISSLLVSFTFSYCGAGEDVSRPSTYWEWMNGNISLKGITEDLEYMKAAGYGGAMIFEAGVGIPVGPVDYGSARWTEAIKHALSEAQRLGLTIDMHNSPGYSGTGGPWISPEYSMKQLVWSERIVEVGKNGYVEAALPRPFAKRGFYKDICVLAYPVGNDDHDVTFQRIEYDGADIDVSVLTDYDLSSECHLDAGQPLTVRLCTPAILRSATAFRGRRETPQHPFDGPRDYSPTLRVEVSADGQVWHPAGTFSCYPLRALDAPCTLSMQPLEASFVRITSNRSTNIAELSFSTTPRLNGYATKAGFVSAVVPFVNPSGSRPDASSSIWPDDIIDITSDFAPSSVVRSGKLGSGKWAIVRIGFTTTGEEVAAAPDAGKGLECDKLSRDGVDRHFDLFLDPLLQALAPWCGTTLRSLCIDSWEAGRQNWTESLPEVFMKKRGYDITPWLLSATGHIVGSEEQSERFLWDFRRTLADMFIEGFINPFRQRAAEHRLLYAGEAYGDGGFESLELQAWQDIPMSEYWTHHVYGNITTTMMAASTADIYGRPVVACESFTGTPFMSKFTEHPYGMKATADYLMTRGVNRFVYHATTHQPYTGVTPGAIMTMGPFGTHFDRNSTWADKFHGFNSYITRSCGRLRQGRQVADVLYLKDETISSGIADYFTSAPVTPYGYRWDIAGSQTLCGLDLAVTDEGSIRFPSGMEYQVVVVPSLHRATTELMQRLSWLVDRGARVLLPEEMPVGYPGLSDVKDAEVCSLAAQLWNDPRVSIGKDVAGFLQSSGIQPDFSYTASRPDARIHFIHRTSDKEDIYFVSNALRRTEKLTVSMRISGKTPMLWDALRDTHIYPVDYSQHDGRTDINLTLDDCGSVFVLFSDTIQPARNPQFHPVQFMTPDTALYDDFTISLWAKPETFAMDGRGFLLFPGNRQQTTATVGITMGQNGVKVYEQGDRRKTVLQYDGAVEGWTHVSVVYHGGCPVLYLNGCKVAANDAGDGHRVAVCLAHQTEQMNNSGFEGDQTAAEFFPRPLNEAEVREIYVRGLPPVGCEGEELMDLTNGWTVRFPRQSKAPAEITLDTLRSLHLHPDFNVRHFSGTASYCKHFSLTSSQVRSMKRHRVILSLGRVENMAEVQVNGYGDTLLWKSPFCLDITGLLHAGDNELCVNVTNLYPNRMIGDEYLPEEDEYDQYGCIRNLPDWYLSDQPATGRQRVLFSTWRHYTKDSPLSEAGLTGPVGIYLIDE